MTTIRITPARESAALIVGVIKVFTLGCTYPSADLLQLLSHVFVALMFAKPSALMIGVGHLVSARLWHRKRASFLGVCTTIASSASASSSLHCSITFRTHAAISADNVKFMHSGGLGSIGLGSLGTFSGLSRQSTAVRTAADRAAEAAARIPDPPPGTPRLKRKSVGFVEDGQLACIRYFFKVSCDKKSSQSGRARGL